MVSRIVLAVGIAAWTLLAWAGRIPQLSEAEQGDVGNWVRIGGSLLIGAAAVAVLVAAPGALERWVLTVFSVWSTVIWVRSLLTVWSGVESAAFKAVHTLLAVGFLLLAYLAMRRGRGLGR